MAGYCTIAVVRFKFRNKWATFKCLPGNVDMILRHFVEDGVQAVTVKYRTVPVERARAHR